MQKITPFLWFDGKAEEAINFYTSVFADSRIVKISRWKEGSPFPAGQVMAGTFELNGQTFYAIDAGPQFRFTEAISFFINCRDQEEIDYYWEKLAEGGTQQMCGWLKDQFGISWQVVPEVLNSLLHGNDPEKSGRVAHALMQMQKIDIATLQTAYNG